MAGATVLVDMDNTVADFDGEFGRRWAAAGGLEAGGGGGLGERRHFELEENLPRGLRPLAMDIMGQPGFYRAFAPVPGALKALREMTARGLRVFLCTAPHPLQYETCVADKYAWVRHHLGEDYLPRIVVTRDKTIVRGAVLVDDKPAITGAHPRPEWTHVLFDRSYNRDVKDKVRLTRWEDWSEVITPLLSSKLN